VLVAQATVQEEDTLRAVASVWAVATWWAGGGAWWAVARALAKPIKHAAAVVLALDPVIGHRRRLRSCGGRTTNRGDCSEAVGRPSMCLIRDGLCVASRVKQAITVVQQSHTASRWGTWRGCAWTGWGGGGGYRRTEAVLGSGVAAKKVMCDPPSCRFYVLNAGGLRQSRGARPRLMFDNPS